MGWDIDDIILNRIKVEILGDRYAGCEYSMATSKSPVVIRYRGEMGTKEREKIVSLFPDFIRVEFQWTDMKEQFTRVYGQGQESNTSVVVITPNDFDQEKLKQFLLRLGLNSVTCINKGEI